MLRVGEFDMRYEDRGPLGHGGMGDVHLAYDTQLHRLVAVKFLKAELAADPVFRAWYDREARLIANLEHEAIVQIYSKGFDADGRPYIEMRYLSGGTLKDRLSGGPAAAADPLTLPRIAEIVDRLAAALDFAHDNDVVHLDLKPSNILFDKSDATGKAFLSDFGIARRLVDGGGAVFAGGQGTPAYKAPEQWRDEPVDRQTDYYQLGALLYEMLSGRRLFDGQGDALRNQHLFAAVPQLDGRSLGLPREAARRLNALLRRALAKRPEERAFPNAAAIAAELRAIVERRPWTERRQGSEQPTAPTAPAAPLPAPIAHPAPRRAWAAGWIAGSATGWGLSTLVAVVVLLLAALQNNALGPALLDPTLSGAPALVLAAGGVVVVLSALLSGALGGVLGSLPVAWAAHGVLARARATAPAHLARQAGLTWAVFLTIGLAYSFSGLVLSLTAVSEGVGRSGLVVDFLVNTFTFGAPVPAVGAALITAWQLQRSAPTLHAGHLAALVLGWTTGGVLTWLVAALLTPLSALLLGSLLIVAGAG